jgi:hypothetical protein
MAVGASGYYNNRGAVHVLFMNPSGTVKRTQQINQFFGGGPPQAPHDFFGSSVESLGDLDGDGVTDLAVGASARHTVYVLFLNTDGTVKAHQKITAGIGGDPALADAVFFGSSLASIGDLDGDGVTDLAVGAYGNNNRRGAVYVLFMNGNGTVKGSQKIDNVDSNPQSHFFGFGLANLGDIDGDSVTDLAVGASGPTGYGADAAYVLLLNANGTVKSSQKLTGSNRFGTSVAALGDIDADGVTDLAVGAPDTGAFPFSSGVVEILLLNSNGTVKRREQLGRGAGGVPSIGGFGISVASLGDLDGDGLTDLAVGRRDIHGAVYVLFLKPQIVNPVFTSPSMVNVIENSTSVMNVTATHEDIAPRPITFSLAGGADQSKFAITSEGALSFIAPPDFDMPADANGDNIYEVIVRASNDIGGTATQTILVTVIFAPSDFGDAPDTGPGTSRGNYQTLLSDSGPRHVVIAGLQLGGTVGPNNGTDQNSAANADRDDGLPNPAADLVLTIGAQSTVNVRVTNTTDTAAALHGWIDYSADGIFDNITERASIAVPTGSNNAAVTLVFPTTPPFYIGPTYARFRLSTDPAAANPTGPANDGEVEDYRMTIMWPSSGKADGTRTTKIGSGMGGGPPLANNDKFGSAVTYLGDLDGDGIGDLAVGAPSQTGAPSGGTIQILFMTAAGTVKTSQEIGFNVGGGPTLANGDYFGHAVAALGDLDGDGVTDLAVGASKDDTGGYINGAVYILFLNTSGTVKSTQKIASGVGGGPTLANGDRFGSSVASIGDLDGDGIGDLAAGAISDDTGGDYRGAVHVLFMNSSGTVKGSQKIASGAGGGPVLANGDVFGISVAALGDLDGDAISDLAVGAMFDDTGGSGRGAVHVLFMNPNGTVKNSQKIASGIGGGPTLNDGDYFGRSVASLGDLNGDGVHDLAVGAYRDDTGGSGRGALHVLFLNANGRVQGSEKIASATGGGPQLLDDDRFGSGVAAIGDLDGDDVAELAVGAETDHTVGTNRGAVHVLFLLPAPVGVPGDFNQNNTVDTADFVAWRNTLGLNVPPFTGADGSGNGVVDQADYDVWRANFGRTVPVSASAASHATPRLRAVRDRERSLEADSTQSLVSPATTIHMKINDAAPRSVRTRPAARLPQWAAAARDDAILAWISSRSDTMDGIRLPAAFASAVSDVAAKRPEISITEIETAFAAIYWDSRQTGPANPWKSY